MTFFTSSIRITVITLTLWKYANSLICTARDVTRERGAQGCSTAVSPEPSPRLSFLTGMSNSGAARMIQGRARPDTASDPGRIRTEHLLRSTRCPKRKRKDRSTQPGFLHFLRNAIWATAASPLTSEGVSCYGLNIIFFLSSHRALTHHPW